MRKRIIILSAILMLGITILVQDFSVKGKQVDLFNELLAETNSKVVEYGITAIFTTNEDGKSVCDDLLKRLGVYDHYNTSVSKDNKTYCVEFGKNDTNGYIETIQYENHNIVTINLIKRDESNKLDNLRNIIGKSINSKENNVKYFQYMKAKLPINNIDAVNNKILNTIKGYGGTNIDVVKLENGYSTTAYTKMYDSIQNNGELIDFNYAVCKYDSGSYIIIGTPEINVTY